MKNNQKGFVVPLILAIIAVLAIGGGVYYYKQAKSSDESNKINYFQVPELGLKFKITPDLNDLVYKIEDFGGEHGKVAYFSSVTLIQADKAAGGRHCSLEEGGGLGALGLWTTGKDKYVPNGYYTHPQAPCSDNKSVQDLENSLIASFQDALKTSEVITTQNNSVSEVTRTADWKTYINSKYGFSFKYPSEWGDLISSTNGGRNVISTSDHSFSVLIGPLPDSRGQSTSYASIKSYFKNLILNTESTPEYLNKIAKGEAGYSDLYDTTIGGQPAFTTISRSGKGIVQIYSYAEYMPENNSLFEVSYGLNPQRNLTNADHEIYKQILASFTFTHSANLTWKTYTNTKYGFQLQYPPNWNFEDGSDSWHLIDGLKFNVGLSSPVRHDVKGYEKPSGFFYRLALDLSNRKVKVNVQGFSKVGLGDQDSVPIQNPTGLKFEDTQEYITAQQIIASIKFIPPTISTTSDWKTYTDVQNKFSIAYPSDFSVMNSGSADFSAPYPAIAFSFPDSYKTGTNLDSAKVLVSTADSCPSFSNYGSVKISSYISNGNTFTVTVAGDAAMGGQRGTYTFYTLSKNNKCYVIDKQILYHDLTFLKEAGVHILTDIRDI